MQELWTQWEPIQGLSKKYYIEAVSNNFEELKILLCDVSDNKKNVRVIFNRSVDAFRTYEIDQSKALFRDWTFFKIENSTYLQWLSEESFTITESIPLTHYVIYGTNIALDIVDTQEPTVELIGF